VDPNDRARRRRQIRITAVIGSVILLNTLGWAAFPDVHQFLDQFLLSVLLIGIGVLWYKDATYREQLRVTYVEVIQSLANTVEQKCSYTHGHSARVAEYTTVIAEELGLPAADVHTLRNVAMLHDIGKIGVRESILNKKGPLSPAEWEEIHGHAESGARILRPLLFLNEEREIVRHHHEWFDGTGYPDGISGGRLGVMTRILAVADAFDALTSDRPYRRGIAAPDALQTLATASGTQFDPRVVAAALRAGMKLAAIAHWDMFRRRRAREMYQHAASGRLRDILPETEPPGCGEVEVAGVQGAPHDRPAQAELAESPHVCQ
jgi:putative nucleotidyltransferase with HDIG domain